MLAHTPELIALFFHNHLEYITVIFQSTPKQVLAKAKPNIILQHLWMHFQNAKLINQQSPRDSAKCGCLFDTYLCSDVNIESM